MRDFYFIEQEDPERAAAIIRDLVREHIPWRFGLDPIDDIQVITPMHRGVVGVKSLNDNLQEILKPSTGDLQRDARSFRKGDKVVQIRNNCGKEVYNGDIFRITLIDRELQEVHVSFEGRGVNYDFSDFDELVLAYAVSVHKAQGYEFPAMAMPVMTQHYILLQRYTLLAERLRKSILRDDVSPQ